MALALDPALEQRIERELERGQFRDGSELIAHALDLLDAEDDWLRRHRDAINDRLDISFAQAARGESRSMEEAIRALASSPQQSLRG